MGNCKNMSGGKRRSTKRSTRRRSTRRRRGGANGAPTGMAGMANAMAGMAKAMGVNGAAPKIAGGKRRHTKKANKWSQFVKQVYHKGKRADKDYTFAQALQEASKLKKAGKMHA